MHLPLSEALAPELLILDSCGSTNTEMVARAAGFPDFSVLVTGEQTAGRGRLGRQWIAPPGKTIAISVLLRPVVPTGAPLGIEHFGWLPLIAGLAMTRAVARIVPGHSVGLKWPNDVQIDRLKVSGLLGELLPSADAVVMGAGVNLTIGTDELPTATSTSLLLNEPAVADDGLADAMLSGYLAELGRLYRRFLRDGASGVSSGVAERCTTLGQRVRVELPGGGELVGIAAALDDSGRLLVRSSHGDITPVAAGDVTHLRYE
jgi:BirA family biotin operon repressor/biotin-[acetyl-CoA-carboxylase] ligase